MAARSKASSSHSRPSKKNGRAHTPYQRIGAAGALAPAKRDGLKAIYQSPNPLQLRRELDAALDQPWAPRRPDPHRTQGDSQDDPHFSAESAEATLLRGFVNIGMAIAREPSRARGGNAAEPAQGHDSRFRIPADATSEKRHICGSI